MLGIEEDHRDCWQNESALIREMIRRKEPLHHHTFGSPPSEGWVI